MNNLSGGNQQKIMIAKLLALNPQLIIMDEPTRGIDVGAKTEIHAILRELADAGVGIVLISSEMPEIVGMCDRIMIMNVGSMVGELSGEDITQDNIILKISEFS
jgi:ribose transport system ATP-binding protein